MKNWVKLLVLVTFIAVIIVNALASSLPINGMDTGEISDSYPNLFAPAGITFAIWGVIYLLLAGFTFYQLGVINKNDSISDSLLKKVAITFSISSIANIIWIFMWHYKIIPLSMIMMIVILVCLIRIVNVLSKEELSVKEKVFVKLPFSIYFGWITVATIANATTLFVSLNWNGFGISEVVWTVAIVIIGAVIGIYMILRNKDFAYGLVIIWAYIGIIIKHTSSNGFNGMYPAVIYTVIALIMLVAIAEILVLTKKR